MEEIRCKVSILCTAYNHEKYIADALESFVTQKTDFPFEVLVSDDASTDKTADIIRDYAARYPDIIRPFLFEENQYQQDISIYDNYFHPAMRGEYVALCEGDDYWIDPQKLQLQVEFLDAHPDYSACVHNTIFRNCQTGEEKIRYAQSGDRDIGFEQLIVGDNNEYQTSSLMYRRQYAFDKPDYFLAAEGYGDYPRSIMLCLAGKIRFINRVMSVYRLYSGPNSFMSSFTSLEAGIRHSENYLKVQSLIKNHVDSQERKELVDLAGIPSRYCLHEARGEVRELTKPPLDRIFRTKSLSYRVKTRIKCLAPRLYKNWFEKRVRRKGL